MFNPLPSIVIITDAPEDEALMINALKEITGTDENIIVRKGPGSLDILLQPNSAEYLKNLPNLILIDLNLSTVDGLDVLKSLKTHPRTFLIPVILLTNSTEEEELLKSYEFGVNSFISKPREAKDFFEYIKEAGSYWLFLNENAPHLKEYKNEVIKY